MINLEKDKLYKISFINNDDIEYQIIKFDKYINNIIYSTSSLWLNKNNDLLGVFDFYGTINYNDILNIEYVIDKNIIKLFNEHILGLNKFHLTFI